jgi:choline-glycine betaine transporter
VGFLAYRKGLPLTIRTAFYPLIGNGVYGWVGDAIDTLSIFTIVSGVCTSLGLGVSQIATGIYRLAPCDTEYDPIKQIASDCPIWDNSIQSSSLGGTTEAPMTIPRDDAITVIIVIVTLIATLSVLSGLKYGLKWVSILAFNLGLFLLTTVLFLDNTWGILNTMVQSTGHYLQYVIELGFSTDAWHEIGIARASGDGLEGGTPSGVLGEAHILNSAPDGRDGSMMHWWTIFYWGWWISWAPFVGLFIAKISKGRSLREVIHYSLSAPLLFAIAWFSTFGFVGIRTNWTAMNLEKLQIAQLADHNVSIVSTIVDSGINCYQVSAAGIATLSGADLKSIWGETSSAYKGGWGLGSLPEGHAENWGEWSGTHCMIEKASFTDMWFLALKQYYGMEKFLTAMTLIALVFYFITSSDSGSYCVDMISANGTKKEPHRIQKVLWAWTEGAVAIALMRIDSKGTQALQAVSICCGLPYTILLCFMCVSLYKAVKEDQGDLEAIETRPQWVFGLYEGIFDIFEAFASLDKGSGAREYLPSSGVVVSFFKGFVAPFEPCRVFLHKHGQQSPVIGVALFFSFYMAVALVISGEVNKSSGHWAIGWTFYMAFCALFANVRCEARKVYEIDGNWVEDFFCVMFLYPQTAAQLEHQLAQPEPKKSDGPITADKVELALG